MARKKKQEQVTDMVTTPQETQLVQSPLVQMVDPKQVMQFGLRLKSYIKANRLSVTIGNSEYAMVDGWKFAGLNFGLVPMVGKPTRIETDDKILYVLYKKVEMTRKDGQKYHVEKPWIATTSKELFEENKFDADRYVMRNYYSYECSCDLKNITTGEIVGHGHAICTNAETKKVDFDAYAVASMAQTRSVGKAFRNLMGYIMNSAGYESTPAEEMESEPSAQPTRTAIKRPTAEQLEEINLLLEHYKKNPDADAEMIKSITETMHTFTEERAVKCISYLKQKGVKNV